MTSVIEEVEEFGEVEEIKEFGSIDVDELNQSITDLIQIIEKNNELNPEEKTLNDLIDYLEEKEERDEDNESERIDEIKELMLNEEELTEEQQAELEALLAEEESFYDLQKEYYSYQNENLDSFYTSILETNEEMLALQAEQNDLIIEGFLTVIITIVVVSAIKVLVDQITKW